MQLAHRIKLRPTAKQANYFARACGTARWVWNWALEEWNRQFKEGGKPNAYTLNAEFNSTKRVICPWVTEITKCAAQRAILNLGTAYKRFFDKKAQRPKFKKKGKCRDSFYLSNDQFVISDKYIRIPKLGWVHMSEPLRFNGKIMSATIIRQADWWYVSIRVEMPDKVPVKPIGDPIGVDLGFNNFAVLSTGEKFDAPRPLKHEAKKLRRLSKAVSRKQPRSKRREKAKVKVSRLQFKMRSQRLDFTHKLTTQLSKNHAEVCIENLCVKGLAKGHFSRSVADGGLYEFRRQLTYKSLLYGSTLTVRDRFFPSSKRCSNCGYINCDLQLRDRTWTCPECGEHHDRDTNAAKNLVTGPNLPVGDRNVKPVEIEALTPVSGVKLRSTKRESDVNANHLVGV